MKPAILSVVLSLCYLFTGCSTVGNLFSSRSDTNIKGVKLSEARGGTPAGLKEIERKIKLTLFKKSLNSESALGRLRIIKIVSNDPYPKYRLFDIRKGDPYYLLGLRNADVLVAANDWVVFDGAKFRTFVWLLQKEKRGSIEIHRAGKLIRFLYTFEDN